jgi:integrase
MLTETRPQLAILGDFLGGEDMARKRLQQKGDLYKQGGWWKLRWREDQRDLTGDVKYAWSKPVIIGPCTGPKAFTKPEARRISWENFLSRLDQNMRTPQSVMTVAEFVERCFTPEHVQVILKPAGRKHYESMLPWALGGVPVKRRSFKGSKKGQELPEIPRVCGLGKMRLRDVEYSDVQKLVSEAIRRGYSVQTADHVRNCVSAIFTHAEKKGWYTGRNPAHFVKLPEMTRRPARALTFAEVESLLAALKATARAMVLCACLTSMNIAEVCGLRWGRVNLTNQPIMVDGESLPAYHVAVREQWYLRQWGTVKAKKRRRNVPMPMLLVKALKELACRGATGKRVPLLAGKRTGIPNGNAVRESPRETAESGATSDDPARQQPKPEDPVFAGRNNRPLDAGAMLNRQVRKIFPGIGWHDLRRTFATLADEIGMSIGERQQLMGHAKAAQTLEYTRTPSKQARRALERMGNKVKGKVA